MKCGQASEITAYLQGEGTEEERAMLRRHFEQCESCARELAQFERAFGALGKVETIEPSADFQNRVFRGIPLANTQPVLTVGKGIHPLVEDAPTQQFRTAQVHIAQFDTIPEAETIIGGEAAQNVAEGAAMVGQFQLADQILLVKPCIG